MHARNASKHTHTHTPTAKADASADSKFTQNKFPKSCKAGVAHKMHTHMSKSQNHAKAQARAHTSHDKNMPPHTTSISQANASQ
eukprot:2867354-Amphidinium_carterae.1